MDQVRRSVVYADHRQFYIQDIDGQRAAEADDDYDWPEAWSEEAVLVHRIGSDGPSSIAIGTARSDYVETILQVHSDGEPPLVEADHIVEADLAVPSGVIHVFGCMETPSHDHLVEIPPGRYRIRVSHVPSAPPVPVNDAENGPYFCYQLDLWPCEDMTGVTVLRHGHGW